MKIYKVKSNYYVEYQGITKKLILVSSVAFYKGSILSKGIRWKAEEDAEFLKHLISSATQNPAKESIEALLEMENLYSEMQGKVAESVPEDKADEIRKNRIAAERDLLSNGLKRDKASAAISTQEDSEEAGEIAIQPTIGELADQKKKANGRNRFAWRDKKTPNDS